MIDVERAVLRFILYCACVVGGCSVLITSATLAAAYIEWDWRFLIAAAMGWIGIQLQLRTVTYIMERL